jgi:hypothetical protein
MSSLMHLVARRCAYLRNEPWARRRVMLAHLLTDADAGIRLCEHIEDADGAIVFRAACASTGHQFGLELEDASTLYAAIGRRMPFSANSPTASTITAFSIACRTRGRMRICPGFASSQSRDATFETVRIAA